MFLTVISTHEDTTLLNNKSNECVRYLKLSSYFVDWKLAIPIQFTYFNSRKKLIKKQKYPWRTHMLSKITQILWCIAI